ncbi:hypothetical protein [Adlercreutzia equolifaciens]|uniref:hypothetical protein n=1 Tax=Adlercreutzia equolifaciens TaxID=446660 RepID=UPI0026DC265D|nr:hypothetical protein [Adlercreutzia equolifaciens]
MGISRSYVHLYFLVHCISSPGVFTSFLQNPKIPVCIFRKFRFAKSEDSSLHFPDFDSARCRQANARNILDQLHAQKTPVGTRRKSGVAKTGGLVPGEGIFSLVLAKP